MRQPIRYKRSVASRLTVSLTVSLTASPCVVTERKWKSEPMGRVVQYLVEKMQSPEELKRELVLMTTDALEAKVVRDQRPADASTRRTFERQMHCVQSVR